MPIAKQNLIFLIQPSDFPWFTPEKPANLLMNRFCIDEDAAFEVSGVYYLEKYPALIGEILLPGDLRDIELELRELEPEELEVEAEGKNIEEFFILLEF